MTTPAPTPDLGELQGNILRGYGNSYRAVRHLVLRISDPAGARAALGTMVDGDRSTPELTAGHIHPRPGGLRCCLNVGITYRGLATLGVPSDSLVTFPPEFRQGMAARAARLGDVGPGDPSQWPAGLGRDGGADLILTITGRQRSDIGPTSERLLAMQGGRAWGAVTPPLDGDALDSEEGPAAGESHPGGPRRRGRLVHFGYRDGIAQPRFEGIHDRDAYPDHEFTPVGAILLGYPSPVPSVRWRVPEPEILGFNGSFSAFRVLRQDVRAFDHFLERVARQTGADKELVAAKLCGRWRNGAPLVLGPTRSEADALAASARSDTTLNDFGYLETDAAGLCCPVGSHIRRANPRDAPIVPRSADIPRRMIRRGMPFGPVYRPQMPDDTPRGLLGNFICANLASQFEAVQGDWLNLGLLDPVITGTNDALVGVNGDLTSSVSWPTPDGPVVVRQLGQFVTTEGGAYCFLPSLPALRWIVSGGWKSSTARRSRLPQVRKRLSDPAVDEPGDARR